MKTGIFDRVEGLASRGGLGVWVAVLILGLATTAVVTAFVWAQERDARAARLESTHQRVVSAIESRFEALRWVSGGVRGLIECSDSVSKERFESFIGDSEAPRWISVVGFARRVPVSHTQEYADRLRAEGWGAFSISPRRTAHQDRVVVELLGVNRAVRDDELGRDIGVDGKTRELLARAARENTAIGATSDAISWGSDRNSVIAIVPVFAGAKAPGVAAEREAAAVGWVFSFMPFDELTNGLDASGVRVLAAEPATAGEALIGQVAFGGRRWWVTTLVQEGVSLGATACGVVGVLMTVLMTALVRVLGASRARAARMAEGMTADLRHSRSELARRVAELADVNNRVEADRRRAEEASRSKSAYIANVSHEIRAPMMAVVGYADVLSDPSVDEVTRRTSADAIRRNGQHLLSVVSNVLDIAKIEAGRMSAELAETDLLEVVRDVAAMASSHAASKGLFLKIDVQGEVPARVRTDAARLRQVVLNLVGNAVKFTERGGVVVRLSARRGGKVRIQVVDTGPGIDKAQASRLFTPFEQGVAGRVFGGTGLGLSISRRLAELLGGEVTLESEVGKGSTFTVTIDPGPCHGVEWIGQSRATEAAAVETTSPSVHLRGRVLIVEDGRDNSNLLALHLRRAGAEVEVAEHGRAGLDAESKARVEGRPFQLILMDMVMPEIDGYLATSMLRERGVQTPVIALTAHAMTGDRERCLAAGCTEYASKPISRGSLLALCARYLPVASSRAAA